MYIKDRRKFQESSWSWKVNTTTIHGRNQKKNHNIYSALKVGIFFYSNFFSFFLILGPNLAFISKKYLICRLKSFNVKEML